MRCTLQTIVVAIMICATGSPAIAGNGTGLPAKVSGLNGWHGTRIEGCEVKFAPDFGNKPGEVRLLQELELHYFDMKYDLACDAQVNYVALDQLLKLAVQDQNRDAAELIVFGLHNGKLNLDGDLGESYGENYIYPVLLKYNDLAGIIPEKKEKEVASDICTTLYNPSTGEDFNFDKLIKHLREKKRNSLVKAINHECDRVKKEVSPR